MFNGFLVCDKFLDKIPANSTLHYLKTRAHFIYKFPFIAVSTGLGYNIETTMRHYTKYKRAIVLKGWAFTILDAWTKQPRYVVSVNDIMRLEKITHQLYYHMYETVARTLEQLTLLFCYKSSEALNSYYLWATYVIGISPNPENFVLILFYW